MSSLSMRELLEAGAHFGHQTRFWSPKMSQYIFGSRNKIHIINLEKTVAKFDEAAKFLTNLAAQKGTILFVGTKRTSRDAIVAEAKRAGMPYVDQRWLGGMLTNFKTVKVSLKRLKEMEQKVADGALEKIADRAIELNTGARGLRAIVESILLDIMYTVPSKDNVATVTVTEETVTNGEKPKITYKKTDAKKA